MYFGVASCCGPCTDFFPGFGYIITSQCSVIKMLLLLVIVGICLSIFIFPLFPALRNLFVHSLIHTYIAYNHATTLMQNMHHYWKLLLENYYFLVNWIWMFLYPTSTCVFFMLLLSFFQNLKYTQIYSIFFWFCPYPATTHIMHYYYQELRAGQIIICNFDWKIPFPFNPFQNQPSFIA